MNTDRTTLHVVLRRSALLPHAPSRCSCTPQGGAYPPTGTLQP